MGYEQWNQIDYKQFKKVIDKYYVNMYIDYTNYEGKSKKEFYIIFANYKKCESFIEQIRRMGYKKKIEITKGNRLFKMYLIRISVGFIKAETRWEYENKKFDLIKKEIGDFSWDIIGSTAWKDIEFNRRLSIRTKKYLRSIGYIIIT